MGDAAERGRTRGRLREGRRRRVRSCDRQVDPHRSAPERLRYRRHWRHLADVRRPRLRLRARQELYLHTGRVGCRPRHVGPRPAAPEREPRRRRIYRHDAVGDGLGRPRHDDVRPGRGPARVRPDDEHVRVDHASTRQGEPISHRLRESPERPGDGHLRAEQLDLHVRTSSPRTNGGPR